MHVNTTTSRNRTHTDNPVQLSCHQRKSPTNPSTEQQRSELPYADANASASPKNRK
ncbi:hypothetical protein BDQ17DRAFT_1360906 [Cyathus striatus]|nr:hypothetical protein BDQ17DRAFT_1360906 [Cyathus striatus]